MDRGTDASQFCTAEMQELERFKARVQQVRPECILDQALPSIATDGDQEVQTAQSFAIRQFAGLTRKDGKTPLVMHSLHLERMLARAGCTDLTVRVLAVLHDVLEDTPATIGDIPPFPRARLPITDLIVFMTEDQVLSGEPPPGGISLRVESFIRQLRKAPDEVISVEIADRLSDMIDIGYLDRMSQEQRSARLRDKITKCKAIIEYVTQSRELAGHDRLLKDAFSYRVSALETQIGATCPIPPLAG